MTKKEKLIEEMRKFVFSAATLIQNGVKNLDDCEMIESDLEAARDELSDLADIFLEEEEKGG